MSTSFVHTVGDSTFDNLYWMLNARGDNASQAKLDSVEGQLQEKLDRSRYQVISHAYDGFTTSSVLNGDHVGRVLNIQSNYALTGKGKAYLEGKNIELSSDNHLVRPLEDLRRSVQGHSQATHYVVISVGGNDFRERLANPVGMLGAIPGIHERYLQILKEVKALEGKDIRPILMLQYRLDAHHDHYRIYTILKIIGVVFATLHSLSLLGIAVSAMALVGKKIHHRLGLAFFLISSAVLALSHRIIPLKVTKGALMGKEVSMAALGGLMETFYRPILAQAKAEGIPILDLANTFNPYNSDLYTAQIEPSQKGGQLIAEGIAHIIKHHGFTSSTSMVYSKRGSSSKFIAIENPGSRGWVVD